MKNYVKPVVLDNEEIFEGVYASSGAGSDCYKVNAYITQRPETGRENYCIQANAVHNALDRHHSTEQVLVLYFNQPVTFDWCSSANATLSGGDGTSTLYITYNYHNNAEENIGLGDIYVKSADGLGDPEAMLTCNHTCAQHDHLNN